MFNPTSRYVSIATATTSMPDGEGGAREIRYVRRRMVPPAEGMATLAMHTLAQGERLDVLTYRYLGDPTQFWRVCDANAAMNPADLTADSELGRSIRIPIPQA